MDDVIFNLIQDCKDYMVGEADNYRNLRRSQSPQILTVMCSDSRTPEEMVSADPLNHLFTVKNAGNLVVDTYMTAYGTELAPSGTIDIAIDSLEVPYACIIGHSDCAAIKKAISGPAGLNPYKAKTISMIRRGLGEIEEGNLDPGYVNQLAQRNVDSQVDMLVSSYKDRIDDGHLTVFGMFADIDNQRGYLTNVNGMTDSEGISTYMETGLLDRIFRRV